MQQLKKRLQRAAERFMASTFAQRSMFAVTALVLSVGDVMAASKGAAGFTKATQEVSSYQESHRRSHRSGRCLQCLFQDAKR